MKKLIATETGLALMRRSDLIIDVHELDKSAKYLIAVSDNVPPEDATSLIESMRSIGVDAILVSSVEELRVLKFVTS